jgi:hypothetical protein
VACHSDARSAAAAGSLAAPSQWCVARRRRPSWVRLRRSQRSHGCQAVAKAPRPGCRVREGKGTCPPAAVPSAYTQAPALPHQPPSCPVPQSALAQAARIRPPRAPSAHSLPQPYVCVRACVCACLRLPAQAQPLWRFAHARVRACIDMSVRCARACACCTSVCASWHVTTAVVAACRSRRYSCSSTGYGSGLAPCSGSSAGCGLSPAPRATPRECSAAVASIISALSGAQRWARLGPLSTLLPPGC